MQHILVRQLQDRAARRGLLVETTHKGVVSRQSFSSIEARDEYMQRARRLGATVRIVSKQED